MVLLLVINLPLLLALAISDPEYVFAGLVFNPIDGQSYLAKMRQGFDGAWSFVLPYTANPGEGAPLNLYYLFLGHVARWVDVSLAFIFHAARLLGSTLLLIQIWRLCKLLFAERVAQQIAFILATLGSGLGWLALLAGRLPPDFWLSEAYPFLAMQANAHFPLGLALQIQFMLPGKQPDKFGPRLILDSIQGLILAAVYPFGFALALATIAIQSFLALRKQRATLSALSRTIALLSLGGPLLLVQWLAVRAHPLLAAWNSQNQTPLPPLLDLIIALSPAMLISAFYLAKRRRRLSEDERSLLIWLAGAFILGLMPLNLQRRFLSGIFVPLALLAVKGALAASQTMRVRIRFLLALLLLSLPSSFIGGFSSLAAVQARASAFFLDRDEAAALSWLAENAPPVALIAASPEIGLHLPVQGDLRVWYGHPFETIAAGQRQSELEAFYAGVVETESFLDAQGFDFVFSGPRERALGSLDSIEGWQIVYESGEVQILGRVNQ